MNGNSRQTWDETFGRRGYDFRCTDSVIARKDALQAAWERQKAVHGETLQSFEAQIALLAERGEIPRAFNVKTFRRALDFNRLEPTQFENAWGIAVALNVRVEEIFVLDRNDTSADGPSFGRHEILEDLTLWIRSLLIVSGGLALVFLGLVVFGAYEMSRGLLPLIGGGAIAGLAAYTKLKTTFPAPRSLQVALGGLFGNLSAVASYLVIALLDGNLMCDFANGDTMLVVVLYVVACVLGYPAGQAAVSDVRDRADILFIAGFVILWPLAAVLGFALAPVACAISA